MQPNFLAILVAAFSTLVVGAIWYNPKVFGTIWMNETGMTPEKGKNANMAKTLGLALFYAFLIAMVLQFLVIHQFGAYGMIGGNPTMAKPSFTAFMSDYGTAFRTFKHGMLHGFITGLLFALPIVGTQAVFEMRSWKYTLVSGGYWVVSLTLMGGIICAWP